MKYLIKLLAIISACSISFAATSNNKTLETQVKSGAVDYFYVGADNACDYSKINDALSAASSSQNPIEVLVSNNKDYTETLFISLNNILIDGSYANCADARNGIQGENRIQLSGGSSSFSLATIEITGVLVSLKSIQLDSSNAYKGIFAGETSIITLENMLFLGLSNSAIRIEGGPIDLKIKNSWFVLNTAERGAAIDCVGSNQSIEVTENTIFASNTVGGTGVSSGRGAAVNLLSCDFSMSGGEFIGNHADAGGGIFAYGSDQVDLKRVKFIDNVADTGGGAIRAAFSEVNVEDSHFIRNESGMSGGAINFGDGSVFTLKSTGNDCFGSTRCNLFEGNTSELGGAIYLARGHIDISSVHLKNNRADFGTAIYSIGESSSTVEGSVFTQNGNSSAGGYNDINVIKTFSDSTTTIIYSTFADNKALFATFGLEGTANMSVYSSIIYDPSSSDVFDFISSGQDQPTHDANCLIVHETDSFDSDNAEITITDPMFVDASNGDYHISATSPAIDYCTDIIAVSQYADIDGEDRGFDDPITPNNVTNGFYDIGADETYKNDVIFNTGFD